MRVLFIGNSYTHCNDLPGMVRALAAAGSPPVQIETEHHSPGGESFQGHCEKGVAVEKIRQGRWDVVVLQDQSMMPATDPERTREYGARLHDEARRVGARVVFYMTWARKANPPMVEALAETYGGLARQLGADVAPVGLAWKAAVEARPDVELYVEDGSHPSPTGTYLAACVFYAVLTGQDPRELPRGAVAGIDAETARFLQRAAWQALQGKDPQHAMPNP